MVSKRTKESKEYQEQATQAAKPEGEIEPVILNKDIEPPQEEPPTPLEQVIAMTEAEYRVLILELLSEIVTRLRKENDTETQ